MFLSEGSVTRRCFTVPSRPGSSRFKTSVQKPAVVSFTLDEEAEGSYSEPEFTIATHFVKVQ